jgi:transposase-like protein
LVGIAVPVSSRDASTLLPFIRKHIAPGSIIHSDQWGAYTQLMAYGWRHLTVNHSQKSVAPESGSHTQGVESFWNQIKRRLKFVYGSQDDLKERRICEYVYRHNFVFNGQMHFEARMSLLISHIVNCYRFLLQ